MEATADQKARILVVDDDPGCAEVFARLLIEAGHEVLTARDGEQALQLAREKHPALVLLDAVLPGMGGNAVCRQIKVEPGLEDVFVVLISGKATGTDEKVIGLDAGADDYIQKPVEAAELQARIRMILRLRETTVALRASEEHYRRLIEILPDGVVTTDIYGQIMDVNPQAISMLGYGGPRELLQKSAFDLTSAEEHERLRHDIAETLQHEVTRHREYLLTRKDGSRLPVEVNGAVLRNKRHVAIGLVGVVRDVTERKRAEQRIRELVHFLDQARDAIMVCDLEGHIRHFNRGAERLLGWKAAEVRGHQATKFFTGSDPVVAMAEKKLLETGEWEGELRVLNKAAQPIFVHSRWALIPGSKDVPGYVVCINTDITERKRAEVALKEREELSQRIIETSMEGFWMLEFSGRLLEVNQAYCKMSGYSREELRTMHIWDLEVIETSRERVADHVRRVVQSGDRFETRHRRKDGRIIDVEVVASSLSTLALDKPFLFAFLRDITERKQAEATLRASEERFRQVAESIREVFWMTDIEKGCMLYVSPGYEEIWGRSCESLYARPMDWAEAIHVEDRERVLKSALTKQASGEYDEEYRIVRPDGAVRWIQDRAFPVRDELGGVQRIAGIAEDMTRRKAIEQALRVAEANFRGIFEHSTEGIFQTTPEGRYLSANPALARMLGYASPEELMASLTDIARQLCVRPESRAELKQALEREGQVREFENEVYCKDGTKKWVSINARMVRDAQGKVLYYEGINQDITERKRAEEALRQSEARKGAIMEAALDGIVTFDGGGAIIECNAAAEKMLGAARTSVIGQRMTEVMIPPTLHDWFGHGLAHGFAADGGPMLGGRIEMEALRADRTEFPIELAITRVEIGGPPLFTAFIRDITGRRRAEARLTMLAHAVESTAELICITDLQDRFTFANRAFQNAHGYSETEILGKTPEILHSPRNPNLLVAEILKQTRSGGWRGEVLDRRKDGTEFPVFLSTTQVRDASGRVLGLMGVAQDITERKRAQDQIRMLADAMQSTQELICITDRENRFTFVNHAFLAAYGYREDEVLGRKPDFLYSPKNPAELYDHVFEQTLSGGWSGEVLNRRKDGTEFPISLSTSQIKDNEGKVLGLVGVARDVSERKRSERQLAAFSELGYRLSAALTPDEAAHIVLEIASELYGWDAGYVHLYSESQDLIEPVLTMDTINGKRIPVGSESFTHDPSPLMRRVMKEGAKLVSRGTEEPGLPHPLVPFGDPERPSVSMMYAPIRSSGRSIGILSIQSYVSKAYSEVDLRLLQTMADYSGDAFERLKLTESLQKAEAKYRVIFENATEGIFQTTPEGRYLSANPALARMFGYQTPAELMSSVTDIERQTYVSPDRREELKQLLQAQRSVQGFDAARYRKDGSEFWISINAHAVLDASGSVVYYEGTNQDITERKRAESVLRESEQKFRTLFESAPISIALHDAKRAYVHTNGAYQRMLGYTDEELRQAGVKGVTHSDDFAEGQKLFDRLRSGESDRYQREERYVHKHGHLVRAQSSASALRNGAGELIYIISMVEDISHRNEMLEALRQSERKLRLIAENTSDAIFAFDMNRQPVYGNSAVENLTGYAFAEIEERGFIDWIHPDHHEQMLALWAELYAGHAYSEVEFRLVTKDGKVKWCSSTWGPLLDESGRQIGVQGRERDITKLKLAERATRDLAAIVENSADAILSTTLDGRIVSWNQAAENIYGYSANEAIGSQVTILVPADRTDELPQVLKDIAQGRKVDSFESCCRRKDASLVQVSWTISPIRDESDRVSGVSAIVRDITLRKSLEREVSETSANERRKIGHDLHDGLGQYLAGIAFRAKALEQTLTASGAPCAAGANDLAVLVSNAISQTRALARGLDPIEVEANGLIAAALQNLASNTQELFDVSCAFHCPDPDLRLDAEIGLALYRIAQEAIHNAISHGHARRIEIDLAVQGGPLCMRIRDDGVGFVVGSIKSGGMGLRLMQYRASSIGSRITIDSKLNRGTEVCCMAPRREWAPAPNGERPEPAV